MDQQAQQVPMVMDIEQQHADQYPEFVFLEGDLRIVCDIVREILFDDRSEYDEILTIKLERERVIRMCEYGIRLLTTSGTPYFAFNARNRLVQFMVSLKGEQDRQVLKAMIDSLKSDLVGMVHATKVNDVHTILSQALESGEDLAKASKLATKVLNDHRTEVLSKILAKHFYTSQLIA